MINYVIENDANKQNTGIIPQSDTIYNLVLSASAEKTIEVPTGAHIAIFTATGNFYCKFDDTVAVPSTDIVDGSAGELNPVLRSVNRVTQIHLISAANIIVSIAFYSVPRSIV